MSTVKANNYYDASGGSNAQLYGVASPPNSMGFRNRILNGSMVIDQRNAGAAVTVGTSDTYAVDRFPGFSNVGTTTGQRSTVAPAGFTNSLLYTQTAGGSVGASSYLAITQRVEGFNVADLGWGTANAQSVTLSFKVRSSITGTFSVAFSNSAANRAYVATYTINAANTWEDKTITLAGDTSGTWLTDNGIGLRVIWNLGYGSNFTTSTLNAWQGAGVFAATTATTAFATTTGATFYITGVQLEAGTVASPFERRDYGRELMMCQRYYYKSPQTANGEGFITYQAIGGWTGTTCFPVIMRATPTMTYGYSTPYSGNTFNRIDTGGTITVTLSQNLVSVSRVMSIYDGGQAGIPLGTNFSTYLTASAEL